MKRVGWVAAIAVLAVLPPRHLAAQTIHAVVVERHDIFHGPVALTFYGRILNALHIATSDAAIRREILLQPGQQYDSALAAEGARNMRRLGVFRLVTVDTHTTDSGLVLKYITDDGWSTKVDFRFGSTGKQVNWTFGAYEDNLLGTAGQLGFERKSTPDRTINSFVFQRTRLIAEKLTVRTQYLNKSDGWAAAGLIGLPWLSTGSRMLGELSAFAQDDRVLHFVGGDPDPADSLRRVQTIVRADLGWAPVAFPSRYVRVGLTGVVKRDDITPWAGPDTTPRTVTGSMQGWGELSRVHFQVVKGFRTFAAQEDIDLSFTVRLGMALAPKVWGYEATGVGPVFLMHDGVEIGHRAFATVDLQHNSLYFPGGADSSSTRVAGTIGWVAAARHVFVGHLEGGWKKGVAPGDEFDLGLSIGPRAFPAHSFTGDRAFHSTIEYRYTIAPDLWSLVGLGLAAFVDHSGAWYSGHARRTGSDAGVGLRIGPSRATSLSMIRIDAAYRFKNDRNDTGWVLAIGKGFTF